MPTKLQNHQQLNSEKHKFRKRMVPISNSFVGSKAPSLRALAPLGFLTLFLASFTVCDVSALSISVSSDVLSLDLVSGQYGHSEAATIEILSDDALAGYTLTLSGSETLNASKTENGALNKITSEEWTNESSFSDNTWGLKYCNLADNSDCISTTTYTQPTENLQIDKTAVNNSQPVKYALSIGAKTSANINADTYSNAFTLAATTNPVYHSVGFVDWTENMPDAIAGTGTSITLPTTVPTKPGYTFNGWCKSKPIANRTYCADPVTLNEETGEYDLITTDGVAYTNLYATWKYNTACLNFDTTIVRNMQEVEDWGDCLSVGMQISAKDTRDDNIYTVGRLPDGKIWLLDNLRLTNKKVDGETDVANLSSADTNVPENWNKSTDEDGLGGFGFPKTNNPYRLPPLDDDTTQNNKNCTSTSCTNNGLSGTSYTVPALISLMGIYKIDDEIDAARTEWDFGILYNFAAASAGDIRVAYGENRRNAEYDICPKGWRMPTSSLDGEYQGLYTTLGGNYYPRDKYPYFGPLARLELRNALHLPLAGFFWDGKISFHGLRGYFWSSTVSNDNGMYNLSVTTTDVYPQNTNGRANYFAVRCVAK